MARLLYAEDEPFLGKIVKESLELRGYEVRMVTDGAAVVQAFREYAPDLCVLDVMMPHQDGFQSAHDIRKINQQVPILFLTAKSQTEDVLEGFRQGGNDYLKKPFSVEELQARIENLLRLTQGQASIATIPGDLLQLGCLKFDAARQTLHSADGQRKLSFREAELLKYLYDHRGTIVERSQLLMAIWGNDSFFNSRNMDVYITKLRSYLKADPQIEILTIKGVGYRFIVP